MTFVVACFIMGLEKVTYRRLCGYIVFYHRVVPAYFLFSVFFSV